MTANPVVRVTPRGAAKIREFAEGAGLDPPLGLRVEVIGGALSGFAYDLFFDRPSPDDVRVETEGVQILIGPTSVGHLRGSSIDWIEGDNGAGFRIENPNEPEK
jgi:iron-sulfur cluster assembly accessory protein